MMKWWGWGAHDWSFPMDDKPNLWPWMKAILGLNTDEPTTLPIAKEKVQLPQRQINQPFIEELSRFLKTTQILTDDDERLFHSYGKSYPDLFHVRQGYIRRAPDMVLLPESHVDVVHIMRLATAHNVVVIPFGGGTNIVGGVDPIDHTKRMIVTVDLRNMNKILSLDETSRTAWIQAGILGPRLEEELAKRGWSLGHCPDSFEYSTLGGWLATRSAGMQSDAYGKIEDMVVSLKIVTPEGTLQTKTVPASSAGPDLNQVIVGSEGVLGIITEANMSIHPVPAVKDYQGFLFKSFDDGVQAIHECVRLQCMPSMVRLQDSGETDLAFQLKSPKKGLKGFIEKKIKSYLKNHGYHTPCVMVVGFEGTHEYVHQLRQRALPIFKKYQGFSLGKGVGKTWSKDKYNVPYLRDVVMDYGVMVDVAETSTTWANLLNLYNTTISRAREKFAEEGHKTFYLGCHLSHSYENGACLYFTYAAKQIPTKEMNQYYGYKAHFTDTFVKTGGTLSHHHAVGYEHQPWLEEEISSTGIKILQGIKAAVDPKMICNPSKLIPDTASASSFMPREQLIQKMRQVLEPLPQKNNEDNAHPVFYSGPEAHA